MKPAPDLAPLWRCAHSSTPLLAGPDFEPDDRERLEHAGLLREAAPAEGVYCPSCVVDEHYLTVEMEARRDGSVRYFGYCPSCGVVDFQRADLSLYAPDYDAVAGCLSHAMEMNPPAENVPGHLWKLGQKRFNGKTRYAWALRAPANLPREALPPSGVVFTIGLVPPGVLPPALLAIPVEDAVYWDDGLCVDGEVCEACTGDAEAGAPATKRVKAVKDAAMIVLCAKLQKELLDHIRTQRDIGNQSLRAGISWTLPAPPQQKHLARLCGVSEASVSRAMKNRTLAYLMGIARDEEAVLTFKGLNR